MEGAAAHVVRGATVTTVPAASQRRSTGVCGSTQRRRDRRPVHRAGEGDRDRVGQGVVGGDRRPECRPGERNDPASGVATRWPVPPAPTTPTPRSDREPTARPVRAIVDAREQDAEVDREEIGTASSATAALRNSRIAPARALGAHCGRARPVLGEPGRPEGSIGRPPRANRTDRAGNGQACPRWPRCAASSGRLRQARRRSEPAVDADGQAPALEQRQRREHGGDRPAGCRHELVDGRPPDGPARGRSGRRPRPTSARAAAALDGTPGLARWSARPRSSMSCGMPATIRALVRELAQERQAALRGGRAERPGHEEAVAALLQRPRRGDERAAAGRRLDHDRGVGQPADDPVPPRERALASPRRRGPARRRPRRRGRRSRPRGGLWRAGCRTAWPEPMTAIVRPPARTVAAWAAPSIPIASPDTTVAPDRDEVRGDPRGDRPAQSVARRVPTIATAGRASSAAGIAEHEQHVRRHLDRGEPSRDTLGRRRSRPGGRAHRIRSSVAVGRRRGLGDRRWPRPGRADAHPARSPAPVAQSTVLARAGPAPPGDAASRRIARPEP